MPDIAIRNLIKIYKTGRTEVLALRELRLDIRSGEMITILGPSGCGKSTLLNMIAGLDRPNAGSINIDGRNIVELGETALARYRRTGVGVVFQFFNLVPTLTARENIELPMRLEGTGGAVRRRRTGELLELVKMAERAEHLPDELSGGEQQRIAIAVALANDPPLILADEPTGELDSKTGREVLEIFKTMKEKRGKTLLIVTHDERIAKLSDRALRMIDGQMVDDRANSPTPTPTPPAAEDAMHANNGA
ncbi:MAG: ABC transporter ATP-binding protein [Euryarchaeota archaeon]|nr:ABC transporter ATP-binding protein [Euryarchaeota archaeon]